MPDFFRTMAAHLRHHTPSPAGSGPSSHLAHQIGFFSTGNEIGWFLFIVIVLVAAAAGVALVKATFFSRA